MKKFDFKVRMQWGWLKAALIGTAIALLIAPAAGNTSAGNSIEEIKDFVQSISFGPKTKIMLNGKVVALAGSETVARDAYKQARLAYNADGVRLLDVDVAYEPVDKEKDAEAVKGMHALYGDKLTAALTEALENAADKDRVMAYTMRVDDYTVTVSSMKELVDLLEKIQSRYDTQDAFEVDLNPPSSRNVTMYEVDVAKKTADTAATESEAAADTEATTAESEAATDTEATTAESETAADTETTTAEGEAAADTESEQTQEEIKEQSAEDGIKYVGFADKIQIMETYVPKSQVTDPDTAYNELTAPQDEASIYVVQPGDSLSVIAERNHMSVEQVKELNPQIESDDDIYYDDRLNITVPKAAVQLLVEKQETYTEDYNEDIVYEDDDSMYIGETSVVQEGTAGRHTVTDLVTYKDDTECDREQLKETVEVAAVAEIVRRGTKSKPTYMFPVTNWNLTSNFGYRWGRLHAGCDVGVPIGTTVRASRAGQVITAGWVGGYGNCVIIDHGDGVCTRYGHLSQITVSVGQYVDQGQQVALSGNTGRSTGPHLHFEIRIGGEAVDPLPYLYQTN